MQIPQSSYLLLVHVYDVCVAVHMEVGEQLCGVNVHKGPTQSHLTSHKFPKFFPAGLLTQGCTTETGKSELSMRKH